MSRPALIARMQQLVHAMRGLLQANRIDQLQALQVELQAVELELFAWCPTHRSWRDQ